MKTLILENNSNDELGDCEGLDVTVVELSTKFLNELRMKATIFFSVSLQDDTLREMRFNTEEVRILNDNHRALFQNDGETSRITKEPVDPERKMDQDPQLVQLIISGSDARLTSPEQLYVQWVIQSRLTTGLNILSEALEVGPLLKEQQYG